MGDELQTDATSDSIALETVGTSFLTDDAGATPGADTGANSDAAVLAELGDSDLSAILDAIPVDDTDIAAQSTAPMYKDVIAQRAQLRTLSNTVRELQPLTAYRDFGEPDYVRGRLEALDSLFSPILDKATGQPLRDPQTQTTYYTTRPFFEALEKESEGICEQAFADLCAMQFPNAKGQMESLGTQYLHYLKLDPTRLTDYINIDKLLSQSTTAVTLDELVDVPADYHAAYRTILPEVRAQWATYSEAGKAQLLQQAKRELDRIESDKAKETETARRDAYELAQYHGRVQEARNKYFDQVRRERFTAASQSLAKQIRFSDDPKRNLVMHGATIAVLANVLDPEFRFVSESTALKALDIKLSKEFLEQIDIFNATAHEYVALLMANEKGRAEDELEKNHKAGNRIMAKLAVIQLEVAKAMGGTVLEQANKTATAVDAAASGRESAAAAATAAAAGDLGILPPGIRPGTPEADKYWAQQFQERSRNVAAA